jgi:hypothetical protein
MIIAKAAALTLLVKSYTTVISMKTKDCCTLRIVRMRSGDDHNADSNQGNNERFHTRIFRANYTDHLQDR